MHLPHSQEFRGTLFASTCWHIWKSRNTYVFFVMSQSPTSTTRHSLIWSKHFGIFVSPPSHTRPSTTVAAIRWIPPPSQWICLNVDGSVCSTTCQVRIGGLFCDGNGSWIEGFVRNIRTTDGLTAKLWAIFDGLTITWKLGFELVQIQSDCSKAISEITYCNAHLYPFALICSIYMLHHHAWVFEFMWIPQEDNHVVDNLAKTTPFSHF
ncbi:hypothetical protein V6N13_024303 [Hibiscus sabdariffa]|uniref:RNase H type-1 domain-containing protein n=1 Tax=Hibiscus sabdariffa TaxID=183260 RepID=A0ABR2ARS3_9ROSI